MCQWKSEIRQIYEEQFVIYWPIFVIKMSKEKLSNLKKQLEDIVKAIDEDNSPSSSTRASQSQEVRPQASSSNFATRAIDNFRYVCHFRFF